MLARPVESGLGKRQSHARVGIDSYAYHRFFGEVRSGETPTATHWSDGIGDVVDEADRLGVDAVSLETCFIGAPSKEVAQALTRARERLEIALSWGAPEGIRYGADAEALDDLLAWLRVAGDSGVTLMRIVLGGPRQRGMAPATLGRTAEVLDVAAAAAQLAVVRLAIENHGDITASELMAVIEEVGEGRVGVCFDTANALRVGDDVVAAAELLGPHVALVHLKDVEDPARALDPVAGPCSVAYGTGVVPLAQTLAALEHQGFDGLICIEVGQLAPGASERVLVRSGLSWLAANGSLESAAPSTTKARSGGGPE
jgi:sugar phosphate isomerase/epimerase